MHIAPSLGILWSAWFASGLGAQAWQLVTPAMPTARFAHAVAFDVARSRTLLFGGAIAAGPFGDTWEYDGTSWSQRVQPVSPLARHSHALAYDASRARVVLFGPRC